MKMRIVLALAATAVAFMTVMSAQTVQRTVSLVVTNGTVVTMDASARVLQAAAGKPAAHRPVVRRPAARRSA